MKKKNTVPADSDTEQENGNMTGIAPFDPARMLDAQSAAWKIPGIHKANATLVAQELYDLYDAAKTLRPSDIVNYARDNPESELHKCFEWDDTVAAEQFRLQQARMVVCHLVTIQKVFPENKPIPIPIRLVHKTDDAGYTPLKVIVRKPDQYKEMLARCTRELEAIKTKYGYLTEFQKIWNLIG